MQLRNVCFKNANIYNIYTYISSYVYMYLLVSLTFLFFGLERIPFKKILTFWLQIPTKKPIDRQQIFVTP